MRILWVVMFDFLTHAFFGGTEGKKVNGGTTHGEPTQGGAIQDGVTEGGAIQDKLAQDLANENKETLDREYQDGAFNKETQGLSSQGKSTLDGILYTGPSCDIFDCKSRCDEMGVSNVIFTPSCSKTLGCMCNCGWLNLHMDHPQQRFEIPGKLMKQK
uniref:Uncharacterized protein n=1 Tax=Graphocephala atropunctata TaxID=36148 RepID=A0A1B6M9B8_9HEMI